VPIGVAFATRPLAELVEASLVESMITHADPRCALACAAFDSAVRAALHGAPMLPAAHEALALGAQRLRASWTGEDLVHLERAALELERDLVAATEEAPGVDQPGLHIYETAGFVRVAFRLAFWHGVHTRSWRDAVVDVASRGGDADTNAAIVGALLGARDGIDAIPAAWRDRVLAATQPGPPAWAEAHHPRHLLALAETIPGSSTVDE
jgi:ADP-ribosyl-[dinitrogen reductase] hydrolase